MTEDSTVEIAGHAIKKRTIEIVVGVGIAGIAGMIWLRSRAAGAAGSASAAPAPSPDMSGGGGAVSVPAPTQAQADQYSQDLAQDQLAAAMQAQQYSSNLALQQYQQQQLLTNPAYSFQQATQANQAFFSANPLSEAVSTGIVQEKWKQFLLNGQTIWEDVSGKNRAPITETYAEQVGAQAKGEGPYYQSKGGGFLKPLVDATANIVKGIVGGAANAEQTAAQAYFQQQGVPYSAPAPPPAAPASAVTVHYASAPPHAAPHGYPEVIA